MPRSCSPLSVVESVGRPSAVRTRESMGSKGYRKACRLTSESVYIFVGSILFHDFLLRIIAGSIVGIIGVIYVVLEYIPSIEPPQNMRSVLSSRPPFGWTLLTLTVKQGGRCRLEWRASVMIRRTGEGLPVDGLGTAEEPHMGKIRFAAIVLYVVCCESVCAYPVSLYSSVEYWRIAHARRCLWEEFSTRTSFHHHSSARFCPTKTLPDV